MRGLRIVLVASVLLTLSGCVWPAVGFDASRSASNPYEDVLGVGNVATLAPAWTVSTGVTPAYAPVTYGTGVFFSTGPQLRAVEAASGASRWTVDLSGGGMVPAFDVGDIAVTADGVYGNGNIIHTPTFSVEGVYKYAPSNGGFSLIGELGSLGTFAAPVVSGTKVYLGSWSAFATDGSSQFGLATGTGGAGPAAIGGGHVYSGVNVFDAAFSAGCGGGSPKVCSPLWSYAPSATPTSPVYTPGAVFMGTSGGTVEAFDPNGCVSSPCTPLRTDVAAGSITAPPAVANGVVFAGSSNGTLYAFDAAGCGNATCSPLWTVSTGGAIKAQPSVAKGVVYFGSDDGKVYAVNAAGCGSSTCSPLWTSAAAAPVETQVAVAHGSVYVSRTDGSLTAYRVTG